MVKSRFVRALIVIIASAALIVTVFGACKKGSTDGGTAAQDDGSGGLGSQFVSDGGAGGTLTLTITGGLTVAGTTGFRVTATDPAGRPLAFIRIFCESELGIAILEPNSGGVAFESTGPDGLMSGVIGGLLPGSFIMECRGPQGFNLVARAQVVIRGSIPSGFDGFPGAAGGNLGGGSFVDPDPDITDGTGVIIASVTYTDVAGTTTGGPLDTAQIPDCDGVATTIDPEPLSNTNYGITVTNNSGLLIFIDSVRIDYVGSVMGSTGTQPQIIDIPAGSSATISGVALLGLTWANGAMVGGITETGTTTATVTFTDELGVTATITDMGSLSFQPLDRCP